MKYEIHLTFDNNISINELEQVAKNAGIENCKFIKIHNLSLGFHVLSLHTLFCKTFEEPYDHDPQYYDYSVEKDVLESYARMFESAGIKVIRKKLEEQCSFLNPNPRGFYQECHIKCDSDIEASCLFDKLKYSLQGVFAVLPSKSVNDSRYWITCRTFNPDNVKRLKPVIERFSIKNYHMESVIHDSNYNLDSEWELSNNVNL